MNQSLSTVKVLDRDRHEELIANIREAGARVKIIPDGNLIPGIAACMKISKIRLGFRLA